MQIKKNIFFSVCRHPFETSAMHNNIVIKWFFELMKP